MKKTTLGTIIAIAVMMIAGACVVHAAVRFSDNYNVPNTNDINSDLASRQSGTAGNISYTESWWTSAGPHPDWTAIQDNALLIGANNEFGSFFAAPSYDFAGIANTLISLKMDPNSNADSRAAIAFGGLRAGHYWDHGDFVGMGLMLSDNGDYQIYNNRTVLQSGTVTANSGAYLVEIFLAGYVWDGAPVTVDMRIDGTFVLSSYVKTNGITRNFVDLLGYSWGQPTFYGNSFDDFTIMQDTPVPEPVPEPSTLLVLSAGVMSLASFAIRRGK